MGRKIPIVRYMSERWKAFRYARDPRAYWEKRGGKSDFERYPSDTYARQVDFLCGRIQALRISSALEIGCGYGRILGETGKAVTDPKRIAGVDFGWPQLKRAEEFIGKNRAFLVQANGGNLPFQDGAFDLVYTIHVLMHIPPDRVDQTLAEMVRVSRRYVLFSEGIFKHFHMFGLSFRERFEALGLETIECVNDPYPVVRQKPMQFAILRKRAVAR